MTKATMKAGREILVGAIVVSEGREIQAIRDLPEGEGALRTRTSQVVSRNLVQAVPFFFALCTQCAVHKYGLLFVPTAKESAADRWSEDSKLR
jgi:hypothetical protein